MNWTRRQYLATATAATSLSITGCTGLFLDHSHAEDPWSNEDRERNTRATRVEVDATLPEGTYGLRTFNTQGVQVEYKFENETSNPLEIMFFQRDQLDDFESGSDIIYQESLYETGVEPAASGGISSGDWLMAVVNSDFGSVSPDGDVKGTLIFVASV